MEFVAKTQFLRDKSVKGFLSYDGKTNTNKKKLLLYIKIFWFAAPGSTISDPVYSTGGSQRSRVSMNHPD